MGPLGGPPTLPRFVLACSIAGKRLFLVTARAAMRQLLGQASAARPRGGGSAGAVIPILRKVIMELRVHVLRMLAKVARDHDPWTRLLARRLLVDWMPSGAEWPPVRRPLERLASIQPWPSPWRSLRGLQFEGEAPRLGGPPGMKVSMMRLARRPRGGLQLEGSIMCLGTGSLAGGGSAPGF